MMWKNLFKKIIVWNRKFISSKWLSIHKASLIWMRKVSWVCKLIEKLKILGRQIKSSKNLNKADSKYSHLTISWIIVIVQLRIVKDQDPLETSRSKPILHLKLKNLWLILVKDFSIHTILECTLQWHKKEELVKKKSKKFLINYRNFKEFKSSISKNWWEIFSNYKRKVFRPIKLLK